MVAAGRLPVNAFGMEKTTQSRGLRCAQMGLTVSVPLEGLGSLDRQASIFLRNAQIREGHGGLTQFPKEKLRARSHTNLPMPLWGKTRIETVAQLSKVQEVFVLGINFWAAPDNTNRTC